MDNLKKRLPKAPIFDENSNLSQDFSQALTVDPADSTSAVAGSMMNQPDPVVINSNPNNFSISASSGPQITVITQQQQSKLLLPLYNTQNTLKSSDVQKKSQNFENSTQEDSESSKRESISCCNCMLWYFLLSVLLIMLNLFIYLLFFHNVSSSSIKNTIFQDNEVHKIEQKTQIPEKKQTTIKKEQSSTQNKLSFDKTKINLPKKLSKEQLEIRSAFYRAMKAYAKVIPHDEVHPVSNGFSDWVPGGASLTLLDGLDTLYMMGFEKVCAIPFSSLKTKKTQKFSLKTKNFHQNHQKT